MIVQMRLRRVAAVSTLRQQLPGTHPVTAADSNGSLTKVREKREFATSVVEDHAVSQHSFCVHLSRHVIGQFVLCSYDDTIGGSINRLAKTIVIDVIFARAPVRLAASALGENQKIIGEALIASHGMLVFHH